MIYLIDDTPVSMLEGYFRIEDYSDVMTRLDNIGLDGIGQLEGADCIMIHSSYHEQRLIKKISMGICDYGDSIPLVLFSDGDMPDAEFDGDNYITSFKKQRMYSILPVFLCLFRKTGVTDLKILAKGEYHLREEANRLGKEILSPLMFLQGSDPVVLQDGQAAALKELVSLSQPALDADADSVLADVRSSDVSNLRQKVGSIVESFNTYGKNIHSWR